MGEGGTINFITPMVAIGDLGDALDPCLLRSHGIEAVLSLAPVRLDGIIEHHLQLEVADRVPLPFEAILTAMNFIVHHTRQGRRVLLHCEKGISRSPSLAVCYLRETQGMAIEEAIEHVRSARPTAEPHPALIGSIMDYYQNGPPKQNG